MASGLAWFSDYYVFKEGIQPMWEDDANREGGRWLIQVEKQRRNEVLDSFWLELLMAMVGEQFGECSEYVCGAVVNVRQKGDKISLWTKDSTKDDINRKIGYSLLFLLLKLQTNNNEHTCVFQKSYKRKAGFERGNYLRKSSRSFAENWF